MSSLFYNKAPGSSLSNIQFIEDIINGMFDWVRVIDRDNNIIYLNKAMAEGLGQHAVGQKCFTVIGRHSPCENCVSRKSVFDGISHEKEEIINGRVFSIMSSPLKDAQGEIVAAVEVLRDITQMKKLQSELISQNKKLCSNLEIAKKLQCSLLPKDLSDDKIRFSYVYNPCEALGGDFLDIFRVDKKHIGIYIADVSGHGVPAALMTMFLHSAINRKTRSPSKALRELYNQFNKHDFNHSLIYITVFYAIIDIDTKNMAYSNAGHNVCPIVFNDDRFELLLSPGVPISDWVKTPNYTDKNIQLQSGDRVFFYTDGIIELRDRDGKSFGDERVADILLGERSEPAGTLSRIIQSACKHAGINDVSEMPDDATMALLEIL